MPTKTLVKARYILSPSGCSGGDAGPHPHPRRHTATLSATHKKLPGEKTHFCDHSSKYSRVSNHGVLWGAGCPPCLCQQRSSPWHQQRNPVPDTTRGSTAVYKEHLPIIVPIPGGPRMLRRQPTRSQRSRDELSMETSQEARVSIFIIIFVFLSVSKLFVPRAVVPRRPAAPARPRAVGQDSDFPLQGAFLLPRSHKL